MDHDPQPAAVAEPASEIPDGIRRARAAFLRDFPKLMADRKTRGKYVCYHNDDLVAVTGTYHDMIKQLAPLDPPHDACLVFDVTPQTAAEEQFFANGGELDISR
jgi:hypothetical protein